MYRKTIIQTDVGGHSFFTSCQTTVIDWEEEIRDGNRTELEPNRNEPVVTKNPNRTRTVLC